MFSKDDFDNVQEDMEGVVIPCYVCGAPLRTMTQRDGPTNCVIKLEYCSHEALKKDTVDDKGENAPNANKGKDTKEKSVPEASNDDVKAAKEVPYVASKLGPSHCIHCDDDPCLWLQLEPAILDNDRVYNSEDIAGEALANEPNRARRKRAFRLASQMINGHLGNGIRKKHMRCIEDGVRSLFPAVDGKHMGFKEE